MVPCLDVQARVHAGECVGCRLLRATVAALLLTHLVMKLETTTLEHSTLVVELPMCIYLTLSCACWPRTWLQRARGCVLYCQAACLSASAVSIAHIICTDILYYSM
jgi:hypothetical protein